MANEGQIGGGAGRVDDGLLHAALYLADVVEHFDRDGLTVERAVVERGHGGRLVFDPIDPGERPGAWSPVLAGWDPSTGWDVLLAGRGPATRRVAICDGSSDPTPDVLVATMRSLLDPDRDPSTAGGTGGGRSAVLSEAGCRP